MNADACADVRKAKIHSPYTNTTTANARKRAATGNGRHHPGNVCQQGNWISKQCQQDKLKLCVVRLCDFVLIRECVVTACINTTIPSLIANRKHGSSMQLSRS
jgi:hypothetical protein